MSDIELVIKIPEEIYKASQIVDVKYEDVIQIPLEVIANGTPIPDNDCNNCEKAWTDKCERAECYKNNYKHWTPYKKGGKE